MTLATKEYKQFGIKLSVMAIERQQRDEHLMLDVRLRLEHNGQQLELQEVFPRDAFGFCLSVRDILRSRRKCAEELVDPKNLTLMDFGKGRLQLWERNAFSMELDGPIAVCEEGIWRKQ